MSDARLEMLEAENDELRERVAYLEREMMGTDFLYPVEWCLTGSEARIIGALLLHPLCRKEMLMTALYSGSNRDEAEQKIIDVFICKIRRKLTPFGIVIRTVWGQGYTIDEPQRSDLRRAIDPSFAGSVSAAMVRTRIAEGAILS